MNTHHVLRELSLRYPGKTIIPNRPTNPTEIICEIEPTHNHPEYSIAISVLDRSEPHLHKCTVETYMVLKGELDVFLNGILHKMKQGDTLVIPVNTVHYAVGNETWIECRSEPGWRADDMYGAS